MKLLLSMLLSLWAAALLNAPARAAQAVLEGEGEALAQDAAEPVAPWHDLILDPDRDLRLRRAIANGSGGLWVLYARQAKGRVLNGGGLRLMQIDAAGGRGQPIAVSLPSGLDYRRGCSSVAMALDADRNPALLCNTNGGIAIIEPAVTPGDMARIRSHRTDAWPFGLQADGPGRFRVATNDAVLLWSTGSEPEVELAAGIDQVFIASASVPGGLALLHSTVTQLGPTALRAGRLDPDRPSLDAFRPADDGGQVSTLLTRMAAGASGLAVLTPEEKGPQSLWHNVVFDPDMNLRRSSQISLPFDITLTMPLALHLLQDGTQLLAGQRDGELWLATIDDTGELRERQTPDHLLAPEGETRRLLEMQWIAMPDHDRLTLAGTAIVFSEDRDEAAYGLWLADIELAD